jgi:hypothetical protein
MATVMADRRREPSNGAGQKRELPRAAQVSGITEKRHGLRAAGIPGALRQAEAGRSPVARVAATVMEIAAEAVTETGAVAVISNHAGVANRRADREAAAGRPPPGFLINAPR